MVQVRGELAARGLSKQFDDKTNWKGLINLLKTHERNKTFFHPVTDYDSFKWISTQFGPNGDVL